MTRRTRERVEELAEDLPLLRRPITGAEAAERMQEAKLAKRLAGSDDPLWRAVRAIPRAFVFFRRGDLVALRR